MCDDVGREGKACNTKEDDFLACEKMFFSLLCMKERRNDQERRKRGS